MADPKGFMTTPRQEWPRRPVEQRVRDWDEVYVPGALLPIISKQADRCMDCGVPFCHQACPLGNLIPEWNDLVAREDWRSASDRLHATNNFPEFTGRLCPAPCEAGCVLAINQPAVTIKNVECAIADRAWEEGFTPPRPPERLSGKTVAVIGPGLRAHRAGRGTAADPGGAHGRGVREGRPDRRADAVRHPRVQDGEAASGAADRADAGRGDEVPYVDGGRQGRPGGRAAVPVRRGGDRHGCDGVAGTSGAGPCVERDTPGDGVSAAVQSGA